MQEPSKVEVIPYMPDGLGDASVVFTGGASGTKDNRGIS